MAYRDNRARILPRSQEYIDPIYEYRTYDGRRRTRQFAGYRQQVPGSRPTSNRADFLRKVTLCVGFGIVLFLCTLVLAGVVVALLVSISSDQQTQPPTTVSTTTSGCKFVCQVGEVNSQCNGCVCEVGMLTGRITDNSMRPLADVTIANGDQADKILATTDSTGYFRAGGICPVVQTMVIRKEKYITKTAQTTVEDSSNSKLDAVLAKEVNPFFVQHPANKWRIVDDDVKFCCEAEANPNPNYNWLKDGQLVPTATENTLSLQSLSQNDAGKYQCIARNSAGSALSNAAELTLSNGYVSCNTKPMEKLVELPATCRQGGSTSYDVGTCEAYQCYLQNEQTSCQDRYCCQTNEENVVQLQCDGYIMSIRKTLSCKCAVCSERSITVNGHIEMLSGQRVGGINLYVNDFIISSSDSNGMFSFNLPSQEARVSVTFRDDRRQRQIVDTTKIFNIIPDENTYETILVSPIPVPVVLQSTSESFLNLGTYAKLEIPVNSFYDEDGLAHVGEVLAYVNVVDMRNVEDLPFVQGDFNTVNDQGELQRLRSFGMFSLAFTDASGNRLSVANPMTVSIDAEVVPRLNEFGANVQLWSFDEKNGLWIRESALVNPLSKRRRRRQQSRPFVGTIFLDSNWEWFNIDEPENENLCWARIVAQSNDQLISGDFLNNILFTSITGQGQPQFYLISDNIGQGFGACLPIGCPSNEDDSQYIAYFTASLGPAMLLPAQATFSGLALTSSDSSNLVYSTNDADVANSIRVTPQISSISPNGPLFTSKGLCDASSQKYFQFYADSTTALWGMWAAWSTCDRTCGEGMQVRTRECLTGNLCNIEERDEKRACNLGNCPIWGSWNSWGDCSVTCGSGQQERTRICTITGLCDGGDMQEQGCDLQSCSISLNWGEWSSCSVTCGIGQQIRSRECNGIQCNGQEQENRECTEVNCPTWGAWSVWGDCSETCGDGQQFRQRTCPIENMCDGESREERDCKVQDCASATWSEWSAWGDCSVSCNTGQATRTRVCNIFLDAVCEGDMTTDTQACTIQPCSTTPAIWTMWSAWGDCSPVCGSGQQVRNRVCADPDSTGVGCEGPVMTLQNCNLGSCGWTSWSEWGSCAVTCGGGEQIRTRVCSAPSEATVSNEMCAGQPSETDVCADWMCPDCDQECAVGQLNRECDACVCDTSQLRGDVRDSTMRPLSDVTVAYANRPYISLAVTNNDGKFVIQDVCATPTLIVASKARYGMVQKLTEMESSTISNLAIVMERMEPPFIEEHPRHKVRVVGDSVAFCCGVSASSTVDKYEWFKDDNILEFAGADATNLILTDLMVGDTGSYRCRVSNGGGSVYSNSASLLVSETPVGCDPTPVRNLIDMPPECMQPDNLLDIGTCSRESCGGDQTDQTQCADTENYCCEISSSALSTIECTDYNIQVQIVQACTCIPCIVESASIVGVAGSPTGVPLFLGFIYINGVEVSQTDNTGKFNLQITSQTSRVAITFRDIITKQLVDITKVVYITPGARIYLDVKMQPRPTPIEFDSSNEMVVNIGAEDLDPVATVVVPPNSIYDSTGMPYNGPVMLSLNMIDMRRNSDLEFIQGEFSASDDNGEQVDLESYGIFQIIVTDPDSNPLSIGGTVPVYVDPEQVPFGDVEAGGTSDIKLWYLNIISGLWQEASTLIGEENVVERRRRQSNQRSNDRFAGSLDITGEAIVNIDRLYVGSRFGRDNEGCVAKVIPYSKLPPMGMPSSTNVLGDILFTVLADDTTPLMGFTQYFYGYSLTAYQGPMAGEIGECVTVGCDNDNMGRYENYITANGGVDLQGVYMFPARDTCMGVSTTCNTQTSMTNAELMAIDFDISVGVNEAIVIAPGTPASVSTMPTGPIYLWNERHLCRQADETSNHLQFYFESDVVKVNTVNLPVGMVLPCSFYPLWVTKPCMIRMKIDVSPPIDAVRVTVISSATNTAIFPASSPCKTTPYVYGIRQLTAERDPVSMNIEACVEYKCSDGDVQSGTFGSLSILGSDQTQVDIKVRKLDGTLLTCTMCTDSGFTAVPQPSTCPTPPQTSLVPFVVGDVSSSPGLYEGPFGFPPNVMTHDIGHCTTAGAGTVDNAVILTCS